MDFEAMIGPALMLAGVVLVAAGAVGLAECVRREDENPIPGDSDPDEPDPEKAQLPVG